MPTTVYSLRKDPASIVELIDAVPNDWAWLDGELRAPQTMIDRREALDTYGVKFGRFMIGGIQIVALQQGRPPELEAAFVDQRLPAAVMFVEAGYGKHDGYTMIQFKRMASKFVLYGYLGTLRFYSGHCDGSKFDNPARCEFRFMDEFASGYDDYLLYLSHEPRFGGDKITFGQLGRCVRKQGLVSRWVES